MRGATPLSLPVPLSGWRTDVPPHQLPPDALRDGLNMAIEPDGLLQPRKGMDRLIGPNGQPLPALGERVMAGIGFIDNHGQAQIVVSTLTAQYWLGAAPPWQPATTYAVGDFVTDSRGNTQQCSTPGTSGAAPPAWHTSGTTNDAAPLVWTFFQVGQLYWLPISAVPATSGDEDTAYRLVQFGQLPNGASLVYLCNGANHDNVQYWSVGAPHFLPLLNQNFNHNALTTLACSDMCVVSERLAFIDTNETGGDGPGPHTQRVRWSSVLNGRDLPIGAWNDLPGVGNLIAIRQSSRTTAVTYANEGAFVMTGQLGSDAGAFSFDRINDVIIPPFSPQAIVERGGKHWYVSQDLNIWVCDGSNAQVFCAGIHAGLMGTQGDAISQALAPGLAQAPAQRPVAVYDKLNERLVFFVTFNGESEAHHAICWNERFQCWEPPWEFPEAITAAFNVTETLGPTWNTVPNALPDGRPLTWDNATPGQPPGNPGYYATWNDIPGNNSPALYIGTSEGFVNRFYSSTVDTPVQPITYFARWGLRWLNESDRLEVNMVEVLLQPVEQGVDRIELKLNGVSTPYDPVPVSLLDVLIDETAIATWIQRLSPQVAVAAFRPSNYMDFIITGKSTTGGPLIGGIVLYAFESKRGDPLLGIGPNTATP